MPKVKNDKPALIANRLGRALTRVLKKKRSRYVVSAYDGRGDTLKEAWSRDVGSEEEALDLGYAIAFRHAKILIVHQVRTAGRLDTTVLRIL